MLLRKPGPGTTEIDRALSRRQGGAERHVGSALLVARMHDRERLADVEHGVEQMIALDAGQAIDRRDAVAQNGSDDGIASAHQRHFEALLASWMVFQTL